MSPPLTQTFTLTARRPEDDYAAWAWTAHQQRCRACDTGRPGCERGAQLRDTANPDNNLIPGYPPV